MTIHDAPLGRISSAQTVLRQALDLWDGADLSAIEDCNRLLEASATDLEEFRDAILLGTVTPTGQVRSAVMDMRNHIRKFTKLVDASSAFVQGLAVCTGTRSSTYNATGEIQQEVHPCQIF
jgi:hypothetical protein